MTEDRSIGGSEPGISPSTNLDPASNERTFMERAAWLCRDCYLRTETTKTEPFAGLSELALTPEGANSIIMLPFFIFLFPLPSRIPIDYINLDGTKKQRLLVLSQVY